MDKLPPILVGFFAFVIICIGTFSPGWLVYEFDSLADLIDDALLYHGVTVHQGLFLVLVTSDNDTAVTSVYDFDNLGHSVYLTVLEFQIEACLGIFFCICGIVCMFLYNETKEASFLIYPIMWFLSAGIAMWVAIGRWLVKIYTGSGEFLKKETPYSMVLSGIGAVVCFAGAVIVFILYRKDNRLRSPNTKVIYDPDPLPNLNLNDTQTGYSSVPETEEQKL